MYDGACLQYCVEQPAQLLDCGHVVILQFILHSSSVALPLPQTLSRAGPYIETGCIGQA